MGYYIVKGEVRQVNRPDLPDWEAGQLPEFPERPSFPERPGGGPLPSLPPREDWPELPPFLRPGVGLPIPPSVEHPWVPIEPEVDPPSIWPPLPKPPELPDLSGKTLVLVRIFVSRHVNFLRWMVVDHEQAKSKLQKVMEWLKANMPARPAPH